MNDRDQELDLLSPTHLPNSEYTAEHTAPTKKLEKFVGFYLGNKLFAVAADQVSEIAHPSAITPLPNSPHSLLGITAVRGDIVAVVNIKKLLNEDISQPGSKAKLIVLRAQEKETTIGFLVDKMHEVVMIADDGFEPCVVGTESHIAGRSVQEAGVFHLICTDKLLGGSELD